MRNISRKGILSINKRILFIVFVVFPMVKPETRALEVIFNSSVALLITKTLWLWSYTGMALTLFVFFKKKIIIENYTFVLFFLCLFMTVATIRMGHYRWVEILNFCGNIITLAGLANIYGRKNFKYYLKGWYITLTVLMLINSITIYMYYPHGVYISGTNPNYYLFALDNTSFMYSICGFACGYIYYLSQDEKLPLHFLLEYIFIACSYFYCESGTAMVVSTLTVIVVLIRKMKIASWNNYKRTLLICVAIYLLVVVFQSVEWATDLFRIIGKDPSYNGRVDIWATALKVFPQSPIIGFGISTQATIDALMSDTSAKWIYGIGHLHNFILEILFKGGIIGFALFILLMVLSIPRMHDESKDQTKIGLCFMFVLLWITFLFEYRLQTYTFWIIPIAMYNAEYLRTKYEVIKKTRKKKGIR